MGDKICTEKFTSCRLVELGIKCKFSGFNCSIEDDNMAHKSPT